MKFHIPKQTEAAKNALPNQPRKLKKHLDTLPNANMGGLTKQVYQILRELNRQTMPAKYRFENMELLRQPAREIFKNLKKYFINRSLPLPEKSKKIVNLNQSLLQEMAYGYKIILVNAEKNSSNNKADTKMQVISCCRAIRYLAELYLRSSEIYAPPPQGLWLDIHQVYLFAETHSLLDIAVEDEELEIKKTDVNQCYKQILLFSLARPITLRQSDSERVYRKLPTWSNYSKITEKADVSQIDKVFSLKINEDSPPDYLSEADLNSDEKKRFLHTEQLLTHIKKLIDASTDKTSNLTIGDQISVDSLQLIYANWSTNTKRRFSRANHHTNIEVAIGLKNIVRTMHEKSKRTIGVDARSGMVRTDQTIKPDPGYTLEAITDNNTAAGLNGYITHTEINNTVKNSWDMVARGTVLTETYENEQKKLSQEAMGQQTKSDNDHWESINISAGGYCLHWNADDASHAQVGEIIALHEQIGNEKFEWRTGTIRWMQFTQENGLEIGIQIISPKVVGATAQRLNRPDELPFDCLMLPGIQPLKQPSSIILPAHAFKTNDKLVADILGNQLAVTLGSPSIHTGSFTQFYYTNTDVASRIKKQAKKEQDSKIPNNFDEIWSSL